MRLTTLLIMLYRAIPGIFRKTCPREGDSCSKRGLDMAIRGASMLVIISMLCLECSSGSHTPRVPMPHEPNPSSDSQPIIS